MRRDIYDFLKSDYFCFNLVLLYIFNYNLNNICF